MFDMPSVFNGISRVPLHSNARDLREFLDASSGRSTHRNLWNVGCFDFSASLWPSFIPHTQKI